MMLITPVLLLLVVGVVGLSGTNLTEYLPYYQQFVERPEVTLQDFRLDADCILRSEDVGLNTAGPVCWDGARMMVKCPKRPTNGWYDMDDFKTFGVKLMPEELFDRRVERRGVTQRWVNGTTFLMAEHIWPHNIQHLWPVLNVPGLGLRLERFGVFGPLAYFHDREGKVTDLMGVSHPYCRSLMRAIARVYNISVMPPNMRQDAYWRFWARPSFTFRRLLCFERVVVPNKGPSPKYHTVTGAFMSPHVVTRHKQDFLERYYALMASNRNGALPAFPRRPPWRVLLANRREASGRRLTNEDELVQMIREFDVPVSVANFEGKSFDEQFLEVAQAGVFVAPHGATFVNALLLPPGAVAIEVYPIGQRYGAGEWAKYLQISGVRCLEYCYNGGKKCPLCQGSKPYPYDNAPVDLEQFRPLVRAALDMVREARARSDEDT